MEPGLRAEPCSVSAFASTSNARMKSSRENRPASAFSRSRSPSAAISGSVRRVASMETTSRSRTTRVSSRQTERGFVARVDRLGRQLEDRRRVLLGDGIDDREDELAPDEAEHGRDRLGIDRLAGEAHDLVERGQRVAQATVRGTRDEQQRGIVRDHLLGVGHPAELIGDRLEPTAFSSKTCERDWIVGGTFSSSVVAIMKSACGGGSSSDLRSASKAWTDSRCTSSMMKIL